MIRGLWKRAFFPVLTVYIVLSVTGAFLLGAVDPLYSAKYETENPVQEKALVSPGSYFVLYPAEEAAFYTRAPGGRFSPLRAGFQRVVFPSCPSGWGNAFSRPPFQTDAKISCISVKDTILLRLRI
ncbi:MAG: hypothetical protein LBI86_09755 [Treponema sp.]|jgi:hypothetical protein|nr:hypothetical protein [Treponema sp.]